MDPKAAEHLRGAFPWCGDLNETPFINLGINVRDYMAAKAMQGMVVEVNSPNFETIARMAYEMADAMLKAREAC